MGAKASTLCCDYIRDLSTNCQFTHLRLLPRHTRPRLVILPRNLRDCIDTISTISTLLRTAHQLSWTVQILELELLATAMLLEKVSEPGL